MSALQPFIFNVVRGGKMFQKVIRIRYLSGVEDGEKFNYNIIINVIL